MFTQFSKIFQIIRNRAPSAQLVPTLEARRSNFIDISLKIGIQAVGDRARSPTEKTHVYPNLAIFL